MGCSKEFTLPALRTKNQRMIQVLKCCFQQVFRLIWHPQNHHSTAACTCRCFSLFQKTRCKTTCENTPLPNCWESKSQQDSVLLLAPGDTASDARDILTASVPDHNITTLPACLTKGFLWGTVPPFIYTYVYIHTYIYETGKLPGRDPSKPHQRVKSTLFIADRSALSSTLLNTWDKFVPLLLSYLISIWTSSVLQ